MSSKTRTLGAPDEPGHFMGVPLNLLLTGVALAGVYAYFNSGSGSDDKAPTTPAATTPTPGPVLPSTVPSSVPKPAPSTTASPAMVKPYRRQLRGKASPLLYVFVNSLGGEGIFDRLKNNATMLDGNGLNRILTLDNGEFAGWGTGVEWIAHDTLETYLQVYIEVGKIGYNYWVAKSQTMQVHAQAAQAGYGMYAGYKKMSDEHQTAIRQFYFDNYTL
jgi:hypothetical protein